MNYSELKGIIKEELRSVLRERAGSKVLDRDELDDVLQRYFRKNTDLDKDYLKDEYGVEWEIGRVKKVRVRVPEELEGKDWNRFFKRYGYYVAKKFDGYEAIKIHLYPYETKKIEDPKSPLFHVTPMNKLLKIKRKGLVPKKSSRRYNVDDPRIYFVRNIQSGREKIETLAKQLQKTIPENQPFRDKVAVLEIDPSKVDADFYVDPEVTKWGVFTRNNIPPSAITNWGKYRVELEALKKRE